MLTPGTSLMGRYEILERIGAGGMAEVYKAKDTALNRFVAVKILRHEYCSDETFVRKFRVEAQSAAGLQHPNIVSVYDVGEEKDIYYIIMELIDGITLKNYIDMKKKLDIRETLNISVQIAQGLSAAHSNRIIHRDIKPQNIIISRDGKVKVTDFGIARMADSNTVTTTAAGTVSYISPEQARGGYSDEKSDIYSLGITMYEMLTGKVPYEGETNVAVAIKHIQADMVPPRELEPSIPRSFEKIILKCTQKKPEWRYASVQDLITDLRQVLIHPDGDYVVIPGNQQLTKDTVVINGEDISAIGALAKKETASSAGNGQEVQDSFRKTFLNEGTDDSARGSSGRDSELTSDKPDDSGRQDGLRRGEDSETVPGLSREEEDRLIEEEEEEVDSQMGKILMIMGIAGFIILIIVLGVLAAYITGLAGDGFGSSKKKNTETETSQIGTIVTTESAAQTDIETESESVSETAAETETETDATVMVPSLLGKTEDEALKLLEERRLEAEVEDGTSNKFEVGQVYEQSIEAGTKVDAHTTVTIYICKGTEAFSLENVTGINYERAASMLKTMGLKVQVKFVDDNSMNVDEVAYTEPEFGSPVVEGDTVILYVCQGASAEFVSVPDLRGKDIDTAISEIEAAGLTYNGKSSDYSDTYPEGQVMDQSVAAWTSVEKGSNVSLTVSMGPRGAAETQAETETAATEEATEAQETQALQEAQDTIYTASVSAPNPFEAGYQDENGDAVESAQITIIIEQDGVQSNLFDEEVDQYSFPGELTSTSNTSGSATVTEYINGNYYESWTVNYE